MFWPQHLSPVYCAHVQPVLTHSRSSSRRRNGMPASCEPCRRHKVRCDHKLPACTRCQQRRIASRCFYHPAPLTRTGPRSQLSPVDANPSSNRGDTHPTSSMTYQSPDPQPGYLGPTSFAAEFVANSSLAGDLSITFGFGNSSQLQQYWLNQISDVLTLCEDFSLIERLVTEFYGQSPAPIIPAPFVRNAFPSTRKLCQKYLPGNVTRLLSRLIDNTANVFQIPASTQGCEFHELYTGANIRLEILGIMLAQAGRSTQFGTGSGVFTIHGEPQERRQFTEKMYRASNMILQVCKMLTPTNDLLVGLVYENALLSSIIHGDSSETLWEQLGDLSTRIFALGAHRESQKPADLPLFVAQMRKRAFASSYRLDKSIATFLGRPPRLSSRHSDCGLPLCIGDDSYSASNEVFQQAIDSVDESGWSVQPIYQPTAWIRLRCSNAMFREEILDMSMKPFDPETVKQLNDISRRSKEKWESHPAYLRFTPDQWLTKDKLSVAVTLIFSYLAYLYNDFLIQRLLVRRHNGPKASLLSVSVHILSTVLLLRNSHLPHIQPDLTSSIRLYGFPAASVLIEALQSEISCGTPLDPAVSRAEVIRNLCVFNSHIDSIEEPRNWNDALFKRASRVFSSVIDEVIEPRVNIDNDNNAMATTDLQEYTSALNDNGTLYDFMGDGGHPNNMFLGMAFDQWLV